MLGAFYGLWLIYAAGLNYLLMAVVFMAAGIPIFIWSRKEVDPNNRPFEPWERCIAVLIVIVAIWAIYAFARGIVTI